MQRRELLKYSMMLFSTVSSGTLSRAVLAGAPVAHGAAQKVFDTYQQKSVSLLSDMIIPTTDTPGAVEAGVPDFIATIVSDWYTDVERNIFFEGLQQLDALCLTESQKPFHDSSEEIRITALKVMEKQASKYKAPPVANQVKPEPDQNEPFFKKIKELVVLGYYTSEVGSTQELAYRPAPGEYNGNYDFDKVGRQWSH